MSSNLRDDLFLNGLRVLYAAHHQQAAELSTKTAATPAMQYALKAGAKLNLKQAKRLETVFKTAGFPASSKASQAMGGILEDANQSMTAAAKTPEDRDLVHIACGQMSAHVYLASYGTLRNYAKALGNRKAVKLLSLSLKEVSAFDKKLTVLANATLKKSSLARKQSKEGGLGLVLGMAALTATIVALTRKGMQETGSVQ